MKKENLNLNLIRIFAAWMVLSVHVTQNAGIDFSVGANGVQLFFVMSGYLSFCSLELNNSSIEYYKKRLVRILPTYWSCLVLLYLEDIILGFSKNFSIHKIFAGQCGPKFLRYVFGLQCFIPSNNWDLWNNHSALWTMSSFIGFYILAPFLYKFLKKFHTGLIGTIVFLFGRPIIAKGIQLILTDYPPDAHIEWFSLSNPLAEFYCFLLGVTLYLAIKEERQNIYSFIIIITLTITRFEWYQYELIFVLFIMFAVSMPPLFQNHKIQKWATYISSGSFALYLIHPLILAVVPSIWHRLGIANKWLYTIYLYICCIGASYIIYYLGINKIENYVKSKFFRNY